MTTTFPASAPVPLGEVVGVVRGVLEVRVVVRDVLVREVLGGDELVEVGVTVTVVVTTGREVVLDPGVAGGSDPDSPGGATTVIAVWRLVEDARDGEGIDDGVPAGAPVLDPEESADPDRLEEVGPALTVGCGAACGVLHPAVRAAIAAQASRDTANTGRRCMCVSLPVRGPVPG